MTNLSESTPQQLDYAKRPPLAWVSRHKKLLIFLSFCIAIGITVYRYRDPLRNRVLWIYWSRQAAAHVMPGPIELMVWDPVKLRTLVAMNSDYRIYGGAQANYVPKAFAQLTQLDPRLAGPAFTGAPVAFMGTLRRPDGVRRLVIAYGSSGLSTDLLLGVDAVVLPLPGLFDPMGQPLPLFQGSFRIGPEPPSQLRGGVIDARNPSRITFQFVVGKSNYGLVPARYDPSLKIIAERHRGRGIDYVDPDEIVGQGMIDADLQNDDTLALNLREASELEPTMNLGTAILPKSSIPPFIRAPKR